MKLEQFHYLLEINRLRSISAAARSLHIRQTTLSAMVKTVEEEVGFPIFQRAPTGVIATPAGEQFMSLAWEINVKYDELLSLKQWSIDGSQTISLLLAPSLLPVLSIPLTQRFHKFGVRGNLSFAECFSREIGPRLIKGTANIGVAYLTAQELLQFQREAEGRHIATRRLLETRILLLAGTGHPFASLESVTMDMVCGQRLATAKGVRNDAILGSAKLSCPKITNFSDISLVVQAVAEQNMVAFLPEFTILSMDCAQISSYKVLPAVETQEENRLFLCLLYQQESRLRYQERLLLSCIREKTGDFLKQHPEFTIHSQEGNFTP